MTPLWTLWAAALGLLLLALAGLLWPLLREPAEPVPTDDAHRERLRRLYRTQRDELEREHQRQALGAEDRAQAIEELERRLIDDLDAAALAPVARRDGPWQRRVPAALLSLLLPVGALALYLQVGDPGAAASLASGQTGTHADAGADVEAMVARLDERLRQHPDDLEGWVVLARSREVMEQFDAAVLAYRRAVDLAEQQQAAASIQARLHADLADAMASAQGGTMDEPVQAQLQAALTLDANQPKALALAGTAALARGDLDQARHHWQRLVSLLEPGSDMALRVQNDLNRLAGGALSSAPPEAASGASAASVQQARVAGLAGSIRLDPALKDRVQPGDTVFIVVRSPTTGRVPVAVMRIQAAQLPTSFSLDDSHAMSPELPLSRFDELSIEARVSRTGAAQREAGQPISAPQAVRKGSRGLAIVIDAVEP